MMGDVEEGEIIEIDIEVRPPMGFHRCSPEINEMYDDNYSSWTERRSIESFDYNHGRWMDRSMISARRQDRYERVNGNESIANDRRVIHIDRKPDVAHDYYNTDNYCREERPSLDVRRLPQQRNGRGQYLGWKRRSIPHGGGRTGYPGRREYSRGRFRDHPQRFPVIDLQGTGARQEEYYSHQRLEHNRKIPMPHSLLEDERVFHPRDYYHEHRRQHPLNSKADVTFIDRFERLDKLREDGVGMVDRENIEKAMKKGNHDNGYISDRNQPNLENQNPDEQQPLVVGMNEADDDYNLDEYQLLLERHRLIQQHLSAIGEKERNIQDRMQEATSFGDSTNFEAMVYQNSQREDNFDKQKPSDGSFGHTFEAGPQIELSRSIENSGFVGPDETICSHESQATIYAQEDVDWSRELDGYGVDHSQHVNTLHEPMGGVSGTFPESRTPLPPHLHVPPLQSYQQPPQLPPQLTTRSRKSKRRGRKRKVKLKQNLKAVQNNYPKATEDKFLAQNAEAQHMPTAQSPSTRKKRGSVEAQEHQDDYHSVPMDVEEEEYEEIDSFLADDYQDYQTEPNEDEEGDKETTMSEPNLQEREAKDEIKTEDEIAIEKSENAEKNEEENLGKHGSEDEMDDVMLLREQLLQSLATKRAEKARSIIADQQVQSISSKPQAKSETEHIKELLDQEDPYIRPTPSLSSMRNLQPVPSTRAISKSRDKTSIPYIDKYSTHQTPESQQQHKFVIQIGGESDTDDDNEQQHNDLLGGAINDFIKEARHESAAQVKSQYAVSAVSKLDKEDIAKPDEQHAKTLELYVSKANTRLAATRDEIAKETSAIKTLQKKVALRKTRVEQQDAKIKKLRQLLKTAEKTKNTLIAQGGAFEAEIKLLLNRIKLQTDKNKMLEAELKRANNVLDTSRSKNRLSDVPKMASCPESSHVNSNNDVKVSSDTQGFKQITQRIAAMKVVLGNHEKSLAAIQTRNRKSSRTNLAKAISGIDKAPGKRRRIVRLMSESTLLNEKERLQRMERELRLKLEKMKKLSEAKQLVREKVGPKHNLNTKDVEPKDTASNSNSLAKKASSNSTSDLHKAKGSNACSADSTNNNHDLMDFSKTISEGVDAGEQDHSHLTKPLNSKSEGDLRFVLDNRIEGRLSKLFQDEKRVKKIVEEQLSREDTIPDFRSYHPHMIVDLAKRETGERDHECVDDLIIPERSLRNQMKTADDVDVCPNFLTYTSPLLLFRSYRLSPWFRTKESKSVNSSTYSNQINPVNVVCPYDLTGKCLDQECGRQHSSSTFSIQIDQLLKDLIQYEPRIANITPKDSQEAGDKKIQSFILKLKQKYKNRVSDEELALVLIQMFRKAKQKIFHICFEKRQQRVQPEDKSEEKVLFKSQTRILEQRRFKQDLSNDKMESQELRYFEEHYDMKTTLEKSVSENPSDIKSWLLLAKQVTSGSSKDSGDQNLSDKEDMVLNVLSKALEANPHSEDLWVVYLDIFSKRKSSSESREMYIQALEYCPSYTIWWKCLELKNHCDDKIEICLDIIDFLCKDGASQALKSHRLLETLLFTVKLATMLERFDMALGVIRSALGMPMKEAMFDLSTLINDFVIGDYILVWLCLISLLAFDQLPPALFDPAVSGPSRLVQKNIGILKWSTANRDLFSDIAVSFDNAVKSVSDVKELSSEDSKIVAQLYANYIEFEIVQGHTEYAVDVATRSTSSTTSTAMSPAVSLMIIHTINRHLDLLQPEVVSKLDHLVMLKTDECVYEYAKYLLKTNTSDHAIRLLVDSVTRKFDFSDSQEDMSLEIGFKAEAISLYRRLLGCSTDLVVGSHFPKKTVQIDQQSREYAFIWLNLCLLQELTGSMPNSDLYSTGAEEAFESAVNSYTNRDNRQVLWLEYFAYKERLIGQSSRRECIKSFFDLAKRCLACMPTSRALPLQYTKFWGDYEFHNTVISKCLQFLPQSDEIEYMKGSLAFMPTNISLALRLCRAVLLVGNFDEARTIYGVLLETYPHSLEMWKMAISVELKCKKIRETRWLYEQASRMIPYCTSLWEDFVLFEIGHCRDARQMQARIIEIATKATSYGILIMDYVKRLLS